MARRDALIRLHKTLFSRRNALRKALAGELADLRSFKGDTGDAVDVAFDAGNEEIATQLAELEARELNQIERALTQMKRGTYGVCEHCQCKIPVARLNALPYSTTCVDCQREMEHYPGWAGAGGGADWEKVYAAGTSADDERELNISEIEMDISSH
jgi:DnaK suppressor protein